MARRKRAPIVATGKVRSGRVEWTKAQLVTAALNAWHDEDVVITIAQPEVETVSTKQRRYLFGVVYRDAVAAFHEAGVEAMSKERLHELMKLRHNWEDVTDPMTGEIVRVGKSTKGLPTGPMTVFIDNVMLDLSTYLGIVFPPPRSDEDWRRDEAA